MKTLLKNGMIYDGTGGKPYLGDVLIEDDRIAEVGGTITAAADKTVDLSGCQICPGLIDAHSHNDFFYDREDAEKFYRPFIEQGITTQITGNCSFSPGGIEHVYINGRPVLENGRYIGGKAGALVLKPRA